jgi:peptide/nickel transport system ATP-binding protein/oligopeptide transport system ATP-binding protein
MKLIEVKALKKYFPVKKTAFARHEWLKAVDGVDFSLEKDRVFALVGESGCGKSTVARLLLRLIEPTEGEITFKGENIFKLKGQRLKAFRRAVQIVFQDPFASLNPRRTVYDTISEPMKIHKIAKGSELKDRVVELLRKVGLQDVLNRYPHEFSGGQRQRICIARALSVSPEVIVADEPLSALDVSIQAQILNLLMDLKQQSGISFIFISHDLKVVEYFSDEVAVMYLGKIVEYARTEDIFRQPYHPYTEILLNSTPGIKPGTKRRQILSAEVPSPIDIPPGCPFHPRCPKRFSPCDRIVPELEGSGGRLVACHLRTG